ncbi:MAG TPA: sigma-70 family RNA polymerase sigma factor [Vicinamibacterales bacterium]|nr:sigma-70 family RNA polymerase sigma factor [Vicinamibacterales bacterium]
MTANGRGGRFLTTRWTLVNAAGHRSDAHSAAALAELCQIYWPPLYSYLRRRGHDAEEAQDLTQGFFARLLERQDLRNVDPARGRFRGFLLTALKRYAINEHERATAGRRGGQHIRLSLDFDEAERSYALDRRNDETPERVFDRKWAAIAIERALQRLRNESHEAGKTAATDMLLPYLSDTGELPAYRAVAADLGLTEGAVKVAVHRLRQRFGAILRLEISETVLTPSEIDDEMRELIRAVSS